MGGHRANGPAPTPRSKPLKRKNPSPEGIEVRHGRDCRSRSGGRCNCEPTYRAHLWSERDRKRIRKAFSSLTEAKVWRHDAKAALSKGALRPPSQQTIAKAANQWLEGAQSGAIR